MITLETAIAKIKQLPTEDQLLQKCTYIYLKTN